MPQCPRRMPERSFGELCLANISLYWASLLIRAFVTPRRFADISFHFFIRCSITITSMLTITQYQYTVYYWTCPMLAPLEILISSGLRFHRFLEFHAHFIITSDSRWLHIIALLDSHLPVAIWSINDTIWLVASLLGLCFKYSLTRIYHWVCTEFTVLSPTALSCALIDWFIYNQLANIYFIGVSAISIYLMNITYLQLLYHWAFLAILFIVMSSSFITAVTASPQQIEPSRS
jgi:hypothetical protein